MANVHEIHVKKKKKILGQERISRGHLPFLGKLSLNEKRKLCFYTLPKFTLFQLGFTNIYKTLPTFPNTYTHRHTLFFFSISALERQDKTMIAENSLRDLAGSRVICIGLSLIFSFCFSEFKFKISNIKS